MGKEMKDTTNKKHIGNNYKSKNEYYSYRKNGHFHWKYHEVKRVHPHPNSLITFVCSQVLVAHTLHKLSFGSGATKLDMR